MSEKKNLDQLAVIAKSDKSVFEELLSDCRSFIYRQVKKASGKNFLDEHDDITSIGYIAFNEAVQLFIPEKGHFLALSSLVIRRRVIDYMRKDSRWTRANIAIDNSIFENYDDNIYTLADEMALQVFEQEKQAAMLCEEITLLTQELEEWDISMEHLYQDSPRHKAGRDLIWLVISLILGNQEYLDTIIKKKYLPIKFISKDLKIPRKKIANARRYIIACIIIAQGDYPMLAEYLKLESITCPV